MYVRNNEPSIEELLSDEVIQLMMARDGHSDRAMRALVHDVQRRLRARRGPAETRVECVA